MYLENWEDKVVKHSAGTLTDSLLRLEVVETTSGLCPFVGPGVCI